MLNKILRIVIASGFVWYGVEMLTAEYPNELGWLLIVIGVIALLSSFSSSRSSGSGVGDGGGSGWGDTGGDCGGD